MGLGINKDLEPLARRLHRLGGNVEITKATHVNWHFPDGSIIRSGLTMSSSTAQDKRRMLEVAMDKIENGEPDHGVRPQGKKWEVYSFTTQAPVRNENGYPRTFSKLSDAKREARRLDRVKAE